MSDGNMISRDEVLALLKTNKVKVNHGGRFDLSRTNPQSAAIMAERKRLIAAIRALPAADARAECDALRERVARLEGALRGLHHAVCGETGFAACVRLDSGKAYPWPALDAADDAARAALTDGGKDG